MTWIKQKESKREKEREREGHPNKMLINSYLSVCPPSLSFFQITLVWCEDSETLATDFKEANKLIPPHVCEAITRERELF